MILHAQTWDVLERSIHLIRYTRDERPSVPRFQLIRKDEENFATLYIFTHNPNTYRPGEIRHTRHEFVVPCATYNADTWIRWVYDRVVAIETHETAECFFVDGERIFSPHHGAGEDPYVQWYDGHPDKQLLPPG